MDIFRTGHRIACFKLLLTFPHVEEVFTISVIPGAMCLMLVLSNHAGSASHSHDLMVVLCMSFIILDILAEVNELIFTVVSGALLIAFHPVHLALM